MTRLIFIFSLAALLASCSMAVPLNKESLKELPPDDGDRLYTLIYFVGVHQSDVRRAVILDADGDGFNFLPEVEDFNYEILQDISLNEAVYEAEIFFHHVGVTGYNKARILERTGRTIGYEFRPTYHKEFMGVEDLLKVSYGLHKDMNVSIHIRLKASLKRLVY